MEILSDYRISAHRAGDAADLDVIAERVRRAYETLDARQAEDGRRGRQPGSHRHGFLRRFRHA